VQIVADQTGGVRRLAGVNQKPCAPRLLTWARSSLHAPSGTSKPLGCAAAAASAQCREHGCICGPALAGSPRHCRAGYCINSCGAKGGCFPILTVIGAFCEMTVQKATRNARRRGCCNSSSPGNSRRARRSQRRWKCLRRCRGGRAHAVRRAIAPGGGGRLRREPGGACCGRGTRHRDRLRFPCTAGVYA
jgi:hypothetical protein